MGKVVKKGGIIVGIIAGVAFVSLLSPEQKKRLKKQILKTTRALLVVSSKCMKELKHRLPEAIEAGKKAAFMKEQELMRKISKEVEKETEPKGLII
ncbi:MAG: hypothetical protein Q8M92_07345 [Candidatus Subteraquimicrobiales bacterium]|nr:hypothetical protein [Candidatus Subteraquimicrobiales bacterium]